MSEKEDKAAIQTPGPFGPYAKSLLGIDVLEMEKDWLMGLADSMEWMLKGLLWQGQQTELPTEQSDEIKLALAQYESLCLVLGKDSTLL